MKGVLSLPKKSLLQTVSLKTIPLPTMEEKVGLFMETILMLKIQSLKETLPIMQVQYMQIMPLVKASIFQEY